MLIELDFGRVIVNSGINGTAFCVLENPLILPQDIIPAGISEPIAIVNGDGQIDLIPTQPYGIFYTVFLVVDGKRRWSGRFQMPATAKPGGGDWRLSDLADLTPEGSTPDAAAETVIQKLLIDSRLLALVASGGAGPIVTSFNGRPGAVTLQESDIPGTIARDSEVSTSINALAAAVTDALTGKANTSHNHSIEVITGLADALAGLQPRLVEVDTQTGAYTLNPVASGRVVEIAALTRSPLTLPRTFPKGWHCRAVQAGSGQIQFSPAPGGATLRNSQGFDKTDGQWTSGWLYVRSNSDGNSAEWVLDGHQLTDSTQFLAYPNFGTIAGLQINGSAAQAGSALRLTPLQVNMAGSAYFTTPLEIVEGMGFECQFQFQVGGGSGADGFAFVMQNGSPTALGNPGGDLGYGGITPNSIAIAFRTLSNSIAIFQGGSSNAITATGSGVDNLRSGDIYTAWISYAAGMMRIFLSASTDRPGSPRLTHSVDLTSLIGSQAYLGFSGGTGGLANEHDVLNWSFILK
ncbi:L-type lectin-domain containing protein [Leptolyngbya ohadii]|uniref:L-type lectin-domain containing protein n=1 Tax=Leptolyngbya ohadii TaxID=1962290 RepID=UPI000B59DD92|nr:L-type lectin-domain containing protein [Leptolyngbya ohadii]